MVMPTYVGSGPAGAFQGTFDCLIEYPAVVNAGERLLFGFHVRQSSVTITDPPGWDVLGSVDGIGGTSGRFYTKIADGTEGGTTVLMETNKTNLKMGRISCYSDAGGLVYQGHSTGAWSFNHVHPDLVATEADTFAMLYYILSADVTTASITGETGGDITEDWTFLTTLGSDGTHCQQSAPIASPGTISGGNMACSSQTGSICFGVVLTDSGGGGITPRFSGIILAGGF